MKPELIEKLKRAVFGPDGFVPFIFGPDGFVQFMIGAFDWRSPPPPPPRTPSGMDAEAFIAIFKEHCERTGGLGFTIVNARIPDGAIEWVPVSRSPWQNDLTPSQEKQD